MRDLGWFSFLSAYDSAVVELALASPGALERAYQNHPSAVWFGFGPKMKDMFCYVAAARSHVNLGFCSGASLADPSHFLEGDGKKMRHLKFRSQSDVERTFVRHYIRAAIEKASRNPERSKIE